MSAMPAAASAVTTADIAALHERLTRYVHGHFRRKLSLDDAGDAASEALAELDRARLDGHVIGDPDRWLRRAAWRNALDAIRKVEGEGKTPRERPADLADHLDRLADSATAVEEPLLDAAARRADADALARALRRLKPDEHRVLQLRYFDGLDVPDVLEIVGCSRHHYENVHKRAVHRLRTALVETADDATCRDCRGLILSAALAGGLSADDVARRDAHLAACLACRAYARRQRGLLAALPLPALTVLGRLAQRWHAATAATTAPVATAVATTTGAAKVAVAVCGAGMLVAGVCTGAEELKRHDPQAGGAAKVSRPAQASSKNPAATMAAATSPLSNADAGAKRRYVATQPGERRRAGGAGKPSGGGEDNGSNGDANAEFLPHGISSSPSMTPSQPAASPTTAQTASAASSGGPAAYAASAPAGAPIGSRSTPAQADASASSSSEFAP